GKGCGFGAFIDMKHFFDMGGGSRGACVTLFTAEAGGFGRGEGNVNHAGLGVEVEAVGTAFAAEAAGLHAAEGGAEVAHVVRVDPRHARLHRVGDAVRAGKVAGPDVGRETIRSCIR